MLQRLQDFYALFCRNALSLSMLQRLQDFYTFFCRNALSLSMLQRLQDFYTFFCRNALSLSMLQRLKDDLTRDIDNLRVIILTANGKVFSAGHDLKELVTYNMCTFKLVFNGQPWNK